MKKNRDLDLEYRINKLPQIQNYVKNNDQKVILEDFRKEVQSILQTVQNQMEIYTNQQINQLRQSLLQTIQENVQQQNLHKQSPNETEKYQVTAIKTEKYKVPAIQQVCAFIFIFISLIALVISIINFQKSDESQIKIKELIDKVYIVNQTLNAQLLDLSQQLRNQSNYQISVDLRDIRSDNQRQDQEDKALQININGINSNLTNLLQSEQLQIQAIQQKLDLITINSSLKQLKNYTIAAVQSGFPVSYSSRYCDSDYPYKFSYSNYLLNNTNRANSWEPQYANTEQWIQVSSAEVQLWTLLKLQGRSDGYQRRITTFLIKYSLDGNDFFAIENGKIFEYEPISNNDEILTVQFSTPIQARTIRICPLTWSTYIAIRFEAYFVYQYYI